MWCAAPGGVGVGTKISLLKKVKKIRKNVLTNESLFARINSAVGNVLAGVAQPVEQLICNQQVGGSNPSTSSKLWECSRVAKGGRL